MNFIHSCQNCIIWHVTLFETWHVLHILYRWLFPYSTNTTLTVRSVPTDCTGRVFHALRGKHSAPLATPPHRIARCPSLSAWAFHVAGWSSLCYHTRTTSTGLTWALYTGVSVGMSLSSQPPFGCWRTFVTTTLQWWLSPRSGCFRMWAPTTRCDWIVWTTFGSCFC
jgi:hypothetical protein